MGAVATAAALGTAGLLVTQAPAAGAADARCTPEAPIQLRQQGGPSVYTVTQQVCHLLEPDPAGNAPDRFARVVIRGDRINPARSIKATVRVELPDCDSGAGLAARSGTWQADGNQFVVSTADDNGRGQAVYAQARNSSIVASFNGKVFTGGGLFQSTFSSPGCA
jgi:hypothetical protein